MVFIDVLAVFDGHLLAALELDGSELLARNLLSAKCDGVGGPAALLEYLVIDGEQVAGLELEFLVGNDALDIRVDPNLYGGTVECDLNAAIGVPHDARHEQQEGAANHDQGVYPAIVAAVSVAGAPASSEPLRSTQVLRPLATLLSTAPARKLIPGVLAIPRFCF